MKTQARGLTAVGIILIAAGLMVAYFVNDMATTALMGASPKYKPVFPAVPAANITQAPQCDPGYAKQWIGCQKLDQ